MLSRSRQFGLFPILIGAVLAGFGQTVPAPRQRPALLENTSAPVVEDWPLVFEGPVEAGKALCLNVARPPEDSRANVSIEFELPVKEPGVSWRLNGHVREAPPDGAYPVPGVSFQVSSNRFGRKQNKLEISVRHPVPDAKVRIILYVDGAGYRAADVSLCN